MASLASDNNARPQKTDAGNDALDDAAFVAAGDRVDGQNGERRAQAKDAERAHAGRFAMQIAVEPDQDSNQGRSTKPKRNFESAHIRHNL